MAATGGAFFPLELLLFDHEATVFPVDFLAVEDAIFGTTFFEEVIFFDEVTFFAEVLLADVVAAIPPIAHRTDKMAATPRNLTGIERSTTRWLVKSP